MASLIFCQCGSDRVDIHGWNVNRAQLRCLTCGRDSWMDGFTLSEFDPVKLMTAALIDQARKQRKRPPEEVRKLEAKRRSG